MDLRGFCIFVCFMIFEHIQAYFSERSVHLYSCILFIVFLHIITIFHCHFVFSELRQNQPIWRNFIHFSDVARRIHCIQYCNVVIVRGRSTSLWKSAKHAYWNQDSENHSNDKGSKKKNVNSFTYERNKFCKTHFQITYPRQNHSKYRTTF